MGNQTLYIDLYQTSDGMYIDSDICNRYNIGNPDTYKIIKNKEYTQVTETDINYLTENNKVFLNKIRYFNIKPVVLFNVYIDENHNNKLYIDDSLCIKYNIFPISKRIINKITYSEITDKDILTIENTPNSNMTLKRKYIKVSFSDTVKSAENLFIYYLNLDDNKIYIDRKTLEEIRNCNIEIQTEPKVIKNKNCYSITKDVLKEYEIKTNSHGIEKLITKHAHSNKEANISDFETIIIYKDCVTNTLYKPTNNIESYDKTIMNKPCNKISIKLLENTFNKKFIITDVYTYNKIKKYNFNICNANNILFIPEDIIYEFKINIKNSKRIKIKNKIYTQVNDQIINYIKSIPNIEINTTYRNIIKVNK